MPLQNVYFSCFNPDRFSLWTFSDYAGTFIELGIVEQKQAHTQMVSPAKADIANREREALKKQLDPPPISLSH